MVLNVDVFLVLPFSLVLINAGFWLKKTKASSWPVPLTVIEIVLGLFVAVIFSLIQFHKVAIFYVLVNGALMAVIATNAYDIVHGFIKKSDKWKELFNKLFGKKEEVANEG